MDPEELSVRPGTQAGWTTPLDGAVRCHTYGHELAFQAEYTNGLIVGYCCRCSDRVEIPWFQGGTSAALAEYVATDALSLSNPARSVIADLVQVEGLVNDDIETLRHTLRKLQFAQRMVLRRMGQT